MSPGACKTEGCGIPRFVLVVGRDSTGEIKAPREARLCPTYRDAARAVVLAIHQGPLSFSLLSCFVRRPVSHRVPERFVVVRDRPWASAVDGKPENSPGEPTLSELSRER